MNKLRKKLVVAGMGIAFVGTGTANALDLTSAEASGFINGAFFQQVLVKPAGTGNLKPFLRIQEKEEKGRDGFEHGYNTSAEKPPLDAKPGRWTQSLLLSDLTTASFGGTNYYSFLLDINESKHTPLITLSALQIFQSPMDGLSTANLPDFGTPAYDLGNNSIFLDYKLNSSGSGAADLLALIPTDRFDVADGRFIYFYSAFENADAGPEEWAVTPVPEPGTVLLLGAGFFGLALFAKRRRTAQESTLANR